MKVIYALLLATVFSACSSDVPVAPKNSEAQTDALAQRIAQRSHLDQKQIAIRTYQKLSGSNRRLLAVDRITLALDRNSGKVHASRWTSADTPVLSMSTLRDTLPPPEYPIAWDDAYESIADMYEASTEPLGTREDLETDEVGYDLFAVDSTDDSEGVLGRKVDHFNRVLGVSFDKGDTAYMYADFSYAGDTLTGATVHISIDGVNEYIVEIDEYGGIASAEAYAADVAALQVAALQNDCAWAVAETIAGSVLLAGELYVGVKAAAAAWTAYRVAGVAQLTGMARLSKALSGVTKKAATMYVAAVVVTAGAVRASFNTAMEEC